jgi:glutamate synthase (NADPH/NADH) small chain
MAAELERRNAMPLLNLKIRRNSFLEVGHGYSLDLAMKEAARCQDCKEKTCTSGCPLNVNIPSFISEVAKGNFENAYEIISRNNLMPSVCSRVCSPNPKCEHSCKRSDGAEPVAIAALERFVADYHRLNKLTVKAAENEFIGNGRRVAVISSSPAGLGCAGELARKGYEVTVYEEDKRPGDIFEYGIPEFRLPKTIVRHDIENLARLGVDFVTSSSHISYEEAEEMIAAGDFDAVYLADYKEAAGKFNIRGEDLQGVITADNYLLSVNARVKDKYLINDPDFKGRKAVVFGGGVKALDAARCLKRFGAEVTLVFRGTEGGLEACHEEIQRAKEEDIQFCFLTELVELIGNSGNVTGAYCERLMMTKAVNSNRTELIPLYDSEFEIPADLVILCSEPEKEHYEVTDYDSGVFSIKGSPIAAQAFGAGIKAAAVIDEYIRRKALV